MLRPKHKNWGERVRPKEPHVEESFPPAVKLQIDRDVESGGFFLLSVVANRVIADTWHHTLEDAYHQAEFQYGVEKDEWADVVDI